MTETKKLLPCPFCGGNKLNICETEFIPEHRSALTEYAQRSAGQGVCVPREILEQWHVCLSQGDNAPRWEIEKMLNLKLPEKRND